MPGHHLSGLLNGTSPPPNTLSISGMPVLIRGGGDVSPTSLCILIWLPLALPAAPGVAVTVSSVMLFQLLH